MPAARPPQPVLVPRPRHQRPGELADLAALQRPALDALLAPFRDVMAAPPSTGLVPVTDPYLVGPSRRQMAYVPGRVDELAVSLFTEGWCWALAAVLADRYAWPIFATGVGGDWEHVLVAPAPGRFGDVTGLLTGPSLAAWGPCWALPAAQVSSLALDSRTDAAQALVAAVAFAEAVADRFVAALCAS